MYRKQWNTSLVEAEFIPFRNKTYCIGKSYFRGKKNLVYAPRDDLVKYMGWLQDERTFYRYSSSIYSDYDDTNGKIVISRELSNSSIVRSDIHYNCSKIFFSNDDNCIKMQMVISVDPSMSLPNMLTHSSITKWANSSYTSIMKYYAMCYDEI
jgi:hypothetical protein